MKEDFQGDSTMGELRPYKINIIKTIIMFTFQIRKASLKEA